MPEFYDQKVEDVMTRPNTSNRVKLFFVLLVAGVISTVCAGVLMFLPGEGNPTVQYDPTQLSAAPEAGLDLPLHTLDGQYSNDDFVATVNADSIEIRTSNGMLYWVGTFSSSAVSGDVVTSTKIDVPKAVLSQANSKDFVIGDRSFTFQFTIMGTTTVEEVVHV